MEMRSTKVNPDGSSSHVTDTTTFSLGTRDSAVWQAPCEFEWRMKQKRPTGQGDRKMRTLKYAAVLAVAMAVAGAMASTANAQVRVGVAVGVGAPAYVGPAPVCAYGYYPYAPYACAPYGYYGSEWFVGGVFIGAGPWFHGFYGPAFYGHPVFHDRAWVYFHEHGGWRYYHGGARWRNWHSEGWRNFRHDDHHAFHGREGFRGFNGHGHADFHGRTEFHGNTHFSGRDRSFHGNARVRTNGSFHGDRGFHGNAGHGSRGFHGGGNRGGDHGHGGSHGGGHGRR